MKNKILIFVSIIVLLAIATTSIFLLNRDNSLDNPIVIGGQRDSHGCLGPAGYSWNETEKGCVREWEIGELRYQVNSFQSCVDSGYLVMESSPRQCKTTSGRTFIEEIEERINSCDEDNRPTICTMDFVPVCGYFEESIQCIKEPCGQTYSNGCMACSDEKVDYWIDGEC
jgi:hypothetical protein